MIFKRVFKELRNPREIGYYILGLKIARILPDRILLKLKYRTVFGKKLDLDNPHTYSEKLQWLKLYDRNPEYTQLVDKYEVKKYIKDAIGEEYLIPLLGVYGSFEEIDIESLPNQFVLKPNHTSGDIYICKDKSKIDYTEVKKLTKKWIKRKYYWIHREWPYKNIKPRIICEKFISEANISPKDYKVLCFNGKAKLIQVHLDRFSNHIQDLYDVEWNRIPIIWGKKPDHSTPPCEKPKQLEKMIELSEQFAVNKCHVRIDWYIVEEKLYFGEITFFHGSGFLIFENEENDYLFGSWIKLPNKPNN